jgi:hypothetical protein
LPIQLNNLTFPIHQLMIDEASLAFLEHFRFHFLKLSFKYFAVEIDEGDFVNHAKVCAHSLYGHWGLPVLWGFFFMVSADRLLSVKSRKILPIISPSKSIRGKTSHKHKKTQFCL